MEKYWQDMMDSTSRGTGRWITYMTPQRKLRRKTTYREEDYFHEKWKSLQKKEITRTRHQAALIKSYRTNASRSV